MDTSRMNSLLDKGWTLIVALGIRVKDYWQVYFDTNRTIRDTGASAGLPAPEQHFMVRTAAAAN